MSTIDASNVRGGPLQKWAAPRTWFRVLALLVAWLAPALLALNGVLAAQDTSLEEFDEVCPHTKGQAELLAKLGVLKVGETGWAGALKSADVKEALGGCPVLFLETEHFYFASTLESYRLGEDREDTVWLQAEMAELKKLLPKFKPPVKIDPWLRAHLWARRLEKWYADFVTTFGLTPADFEELERKAKAGESMGEGPYLGMKGKFVVLLTEKRSNFGRYLRHFHNADAEYSYRTYHEKSLFYGSNYESMKDGSMDRESSFAASVAAGMAANFIDASRDSRMAAPEWFRYAVAHRAARKVDPRVPQWGAGGPAAAPEENTWVWEPRVHGLVKNNVALPWADMLAWRKLDDIKPREHMLAWSRLEFLVERKKDKLRELWLAYTKPIDDWSATREETRAARHRADFERVLGPDVAALDAEWRAWVLKTYAKKR